jgi:Spy/CpxP family protein refolding chaperone
MLGYRPLDARRRPVMRGRRAVVVLLAASVALLAPPIFGQQAGSGSPTGGRMKAIMQRMEQAARWWQNPETAGRVGVTPEQIARLDQLAAETQDNRRRAAREYAAAYARFITRLSQPEAGSTVVEDRKRELGEAQSAMFAVSVEHVLAVHEILTQEQWQTLGEVRPGALQVGQMKMRGSGMVRGGDEYPGDRDD